MDIKIEYIDGRLFITSGDYELIIDESSEVVVQHKGEARGYYNSFTDFLDAWRLD